MSTDNEICRMDAVSVAARVKDKTLSAVEVADAVLRRMEKLEPHIHAFCTPTPDVARAAAAAVDAKIAAGEDPGPLAGVPIGIKDLVATKDILTVMGSPLYRDFVPDEDDIVIERLKAAGAVIIGKTNVPEFGYSGVGHNPVFPATRNPWNLDMTSGGSSARFRRLGRGRRRAVRDRLRWRGINPHSIGALRALRHEGFDGPGAVVSGMSGRTLPRRVQLGIDRTCRPHEPNRRRFRANAEGDHRTRPARPLFHSSSRLRLRRSYQRDIKGLRIAYSEDWGYAPVDPEVRRVVSEAVRVFETELGCMVERANPGWEDPFPHFWTIVASDTDLSGMRRIMKGREREMSPHLVALLQREWTAEEFTDAKMIRQMVCNRMWRFMANYDLLITPTLAVPAFPLYMQGPEIIEGKMVTSGDWLCFTYICNLTGQPAATIPAGFTKDGLPVGLQIIGRHLADRTVLAASGAFEQARPWAHTWPKLLGDLGL